LRLLLIEDEAELVASLKARLIDAGYVVDVASDGVEGTNMMQLSWISACHSAVAWKY